MSSDWTFAPNDSWRVEIEIYASRLAGLTELREETRFALKEQWPQIWNISTSKERKLDDADTVAVRLAIYATTLLSMVTTSTNIVGGLWSSGSFSVVPLNIRYVFENWGAAHFANLILRNMQGSGDVQSAMKRTDKLTYGARSDVLLPWGGKAQEAPFNVMEFIRCLKDVKPDAQDVYAFLSESSHPNQFQNMYFYMAGPPLSNWENETFNKHGHQLLDQALSALEAAFFGIQTDAVDIITVSLDILIKEDT